MRVLTMIELMRLTRIELTDLLVQITNARRTFPKVQSKGKMRS
jgi:hypothetical protein